MSDKREVIDICSALPADWWLDYIDRQGLAIGYPARLSGARNDKSTVPPQYRGMREYAAALRSENISRINLVCIDGRESRGFAPPRLDTLESAAEELDGVMTFMIGYDPANGQRSYLEALQSRHCVGIAQPIHCWSSYFGSMLDRMPRICCGKEPCGLGAFVHPLQFILWLRYRTSASS